MTILEGRKLPRIVFSIHPSSTSLDHPEIFPLMRKVYEIGLWCFDLPSLKHLESFKELKLLTNDETLMGICHLEVERGVSFLGKPLHQFESKILSTIKKISSFLTGFDIYILPLLLQKSLHKKRWTGSPSILSDLKKLSPI